MNEQLIKQPIRVPENPFWDVFKRFGRDEMIAMVMNVLGTLAVTWALVRFQGAAFYTIAIALSGPIIEKAGFFPAHLKDARDMYLTTPVEMRKKFSFYLLLALKNGSVSLLEDILVHDPFYVLFMYLGMRIYPETPPWLLATASFVIALFVVAGGEVAVNELRYLLRRFYLKILGFECESYYECRFFISAAEKPVAVLEQMTEKFHLTVKERGVYEDRYFEPRIPGYSGRTVKFRLRHRVVGDKEISTVQVVYKRAAEMDKSEIGQFRFFPQEKHKFYLIRNKGGKLGDLVRKGNAIKRMYKEESARVIRFSRTIARDYPEGLFVSIDDVQSDRPFFLVELKVYKNLRLLKRAMRYIMTEFPVIQTTYGKEELCENLPEA